MNTETNETGHNRNTLLEMLHSRVVEIKFEKVNGEVRVMRGTLCPDLLPPRPLAEVSLEKQSVGHPTLINVWDVEANAWRAFHTTKVISVV